MAPGVQELIERVRHLEQLAMATYVKLARRFQDQPELSRFWMSMARHEAAHVGALDLLRVLAGDSLGPSALPELADGVAAAEEALIELHDAADRVARPADAFALAVDLESLEVEEILFDLFGSLADHEQRDQAEQMLVHDLSDLSLMIEKYTNDESLLERADALVERHVGRRHRRVEASQK